jgi:hypothetical protein
MLLQRENIEFEIKSNGSFGRGWKTLQRDEGDIVLMKTVLIKEIIEIKVQKVVLI